MEAGGVGDVGDVGGVGDVGDDVRWLVFFRVQILGFNDDVLVFTRVLDYYYFFDDARTRRKQETKT